MNGRPVMLEEAAGFLAGRYGGRACDVSELGGGDWSRAFSFRLDGRDLVARFGRYGEDFARDQEAMAFAGRPPVRRIPRQSGTSRNVWAITRVSSPTVNRGSPISRRISAECQNCSCPARHCATDVYPSPSPSA